MSPRNPKQFEEIRERSKEKIVYAAFELFSTIGYWSTSISKIAKQAGISKGLMYNYFSSKEHLLKAVIDNISNIISDIVNFDDEEATPEQKMRQFIDRLFNHIENNPGLMRMMLKIGLQVGHFDFVNDTMTSQYAIMTKKIENALGDLHFEHPKKEAMILGATIDGIIVQSLLFGKDFPLAEIKEELLKKYGTDQSHTPNT